MNVDDAIRSLRSEREYDPAPITTPDLRRIVDAGRRAPSAKNLQPVRFVVVTARHRLEMLSSVGRGGEGGGAAHLARAAAAVALCAATPTEEDRDSLLFDLGQAAYAMQLAALDDGVGACLAKVMDHDSTRQILRLAGDQFCPYILALGRPASQRPVVPLTRPNRRPLDDVARFMAH